MFVLMNMFFSKESDFSFCPNLRTTKNRLLEILDPGQHVLPHYIIKDINFYKFVRMNLSLL